MTTVDHVDVRSGTTSEIARGAEAITAAPSAPAVHRLTRDFLTWLDGGPRTHADVMRTWQTSCPRLSIWEDALDASLVESVREESGSARRIVVTLTARGRAILDGRA